MYRDKDGNEISILDILKTPKPDFLEDISLKDNIELLNEYIKILLKREKDILQNEAIEYNYIEI